MVPGGAAQNTARGAQYMLPPNSVVFLGCVGDDKYASMLRDGNKKVGLRVEYRVDDKASTGRCAVVINGDDNENRSMVTDLAAANLYSLEHLKQPEIWKLVKDAKVYYVGGYHFTGRSLRFLLVVLWAERESLLTSCSLPTGYHGFG
jgi:adenosine kinase